jgi:hypothetical protein
MAGMHPVFHIFMLMKYISDPELKIEADLIIIQHDLTIDTQPVYVLEFSNRVMHNRTIKYVKILTSPTASLVHVRSPFPAMEKPVIISLIPSLRETTRERNRQNQT